MSSQDVTPVSTDTTTGLQPTRVFLNSRREAMVIFAVWFVALCWSVPYCYINGYGRQVSVETLNTTLGIPSWLFGGILLPWIVADVITAWICFFFMKDDDLGAAGDEDGLATDAVQTAGGAA
ncbi:MAG: hypothetical protein MK110_05165 [Fuerstiella sp.]|nr:hypothetical protein [Fuerstiella sp.]